MSGYVVKWWRACPCAGPTQKPIRTERVASHQEAWVLIRSSGGTYKPEKSTTARYIYHSGKTNTWISMEAA